MDKEIEEGFNRLNGNVEELMEYLMNKDEPKQELDSSLLNDMSKDFRNVNNILKSIENININTNNTLNTMLQKMEAIDDEELEEVEPIQSNIELDSFMQNFDTLSDNINDLKAVLSNIGLNINLDLETNGIEEIKNELKNSLFVDFDTDIITEKISLIKDTIENLQDNNQIDILLNINKIEDVQDDINNLKLKLDSISNIDLNFDVNNLDLNFDVNKLDLNFDNINEYSNILDNISEKIKGIDNIDIKINIEENIDSINEKLQGLKINDNLDISFKINNMNDIEDNISSLKENINSLTNIEDLNFDKLQDNLDGLKIDNLESIKNNINQQLNDIKINIDNIDDIKLKNLFDSITFDNIKDDLSNLNQVIESVNELSNINIFDGLNNIDISDFKNNISEVVDMLSDIKIKPELVDIPDNINIDLKINPYIEDIDLPTIKTKIEIDTEDISNNFNISNSNQNEKNETNAQILNQLMINNDILKGIMGSMNNNQTINQNNTNNETNIVAKAETGTESDQQMDNMSMLVTSVNEMVESNRKIYKELLKSRFGKDTLDI